MKRTPLRLQVMGMLGAEPVNLAVLYRRSGLTRQAILQALRLAASTGLCVLARERAASAENAAHFTARITEAGCDWLAAPEAVKPVVVRPRRIQGAKYQGIDSGIAGASSLLRQAW
jgi:hypothetical protein